MSLNNAPASSATQVVNELIATYEPVIWLLWAAAIVGIPLVINELRIRRLERIYQCERRRWWRLT